MKIMHSLLLSSDYQMLILSNMGFLARKGKDKH